MIVDTYEIEKIFDRFIGVDHLHLNEFMNEDNPTMEFMAKYFYDNLKEDIPLLSAVTVYETPEGSVTYCISGEVPGYKKSELVKYLKTINNSLAFVDSVTVNTNFLISYETGTTKVLKAKKYNIPVYTIDDVIDHYGK